MFFNVSTDSAFCGSFSPIRWIWWSCGDNYVTDSSEKRLWVVDTLRTVTGEIVDVNSTFVIDSSDCNRFYSHWPIRRKFLNFRDGGVRIVCPPVELSERR